MPAPAGPRFTPLCGAALPQEGGDPYHPRLTGRVSSRWARKASELLAGSVGPLRAPTSPTPTPAFGGGPGCWVSSASQHQAPPTQPCPTQPHTATKHQKHTQGGGAAPSKCAGVTFFCMSPCLPGQSGSGAISASPVFTQERV